MYCKKCGAKIEQGQKFCSKCGTPVPAAEPSSEAKKENGEAHTIVDSLNEYVGGGQNHVELNWKDLFRDVFKRHSEAEAEEIFACGTKNTTPEVSSISSSWPRPWLYSRVFIGFLIAFIFFLNSATKYVICY